MALVELDLLMFLHYAPSSYLNRKNEFKHSKNRVIYKESMCIETNSKLQ
jgi:hypothetical protein